MTAPPDWYAAGLDHIWLPYAQMKTASPPLAVAATRGSRIVLADGRELIDGIASWWTACHGYNHPHIRAAVERQLAGMPHVMFGGLVHEQALTLARRLVGDARRKRPRLRPRPRVLQRFRLGRGRSRAENGGAILAQPRRSRPHPHRRIQGRLSRRHHRRHGGVGSASRHACRVPRALAGADRGRFAGRRGQHGGARSNAGSGAPRRWPPSSSSPWFRAPAACAFTTPAC